MAKVCFGVNENISFYKKSASSNRIRSRGSWRSRTAVHGFADRCLATRPRNHVSFRTANLKKNVFPAICKVRFYFLSFSQLRFVRLRVAFSCQFPEQESKLILGFLPSLSKFEKLFLPFPSFSLLTLKNIFQKLLNLFRIYELKV